MPHFRKVAGIDRHRPNKATTKCAENTDAPLRRHHNFLKEFQNFCEFGKFYSF